jgi:hypothetical protein
LDSHETYDKLKALVLKHMRVLKSIDRSNPKPAHLIDDEGRQRSEASEDGGDSGAGEEIEDEEHAQWLEKLAEAETAVERVEFAPTRGQGGPRKKGTGEIRAEDSSDGRSAWSSATSRQE